MTADLRIMGDDREQAGDSRSIPGVPMSEVERASMRSYAAAVRRLADQVEKALMEPVLSCQSVAFEVAQLAPEPQSAETRQDPDVLGTPGSAVAQVEAALSRLKQTDKCLLATTEICERGAMEAARQLDRDGPAKGRPLHGMPLVVKDVIDIAGSATRANCRALSDQPAKADAAIVARVREAGGIPIAKAVSWELSFAETDDRTALHARAINPWSPRHDTGGSSSGVAALVAAGCSPAGLGTDTGGSSRAPAAWCGIVGFKPSTGILPLTGSLPLSPFFDCLGILARDAAACMQLFQGISDRETCQNSCKAGRSVRVGLWRDAYRSSSPADPEVAALFEAAVARLPSLGIEVVEMNLPPLDLYSAAFVILARYETFRTWRHLLEMDVASLGRTMRERLRACSLFDERLVAQAWELRARLLSATQTAMQDVDAIVLPTMPTAAPLIADAGAPMVFDRPTYVRFASLLGLPSLSLPCGLASDVLPVGLMLNGRQGEDSRLLEIAARVEQACPALGTAPACRIEL
jgi:aspartyl-tRNA(Asn)/glutamyl-tRNA(Gln) amidotransferase subunit A